MREIRIFVASSSELLSERNRLAYLVLAHEADFEGRGLRVRLSKWEYVDPAMTEERSEDRYLNEMLGCDAALVLFKNVLGKYTEEEVVKAIAAEKQGNSRLKAHRLLFCEDGAKPSPALATYRDSLAPDDYGCFSGMSDLEREFLALVDRLAAMDLHDAQSEDGLRVVSAFLAADDELAADRDAFADMVLNLNNILARRGMRVRLQFYDVARHRELMESCEMALVVYHTNCRAFGAEQIRDAYNRTRRDENPRRLYVFFRDVNPAALDEEFRSFRDAFEGDMQHFFCRFENVDTLKLNFLLSLESSLDESASFVRLDGRMVQADGMDVAEITSLPMVANNQALNNLMSQVEQTFEMFERQREECRRHPDDEGGFARLCELSQRKGDLQAELDKELSRSFNLAKRMAALSEKDANGTLTRAMRLLDQGHIDEAVRLLDGAASKIDAILGKMTDLETAMEQTLTPLEAWIEVELFRADTVLAFSREPFQARFAKVEGIFKVLLSKVERPLAKFRPRTLANVLSRFAWLYVEVDDSVTPIPLRKKALKMLEVADSLEPGSCSLLRAKEHRLIASLEYDNNQLEEAEADYLLALDIYQKQPVFYNWNMAKCLRGLALLHRNTNKLLDALVESSLALETFRHLTASHAGKYDNDVASALNILGSLYSDVNNMHKAESSYRESLEIRRRLARENWKEGAEDLAMALSNMATFHMSMQNTATAEEEFVESLDIYRALAEDNPAKFDFQVATTLPCLATLHMNTSRMQQAEEEFLESQRILQRYASSNMLRYGDSLAYVLTNLALLHMSLSRTDEAEHEHREALRIRRDLAKESPEKFDEQIALSLNYLACLHTIQDRNDESEREYMEALEIFRRLAQKNPEKFDFLVAHSLNNLALFHSNAGVYDKAEPEYAEALSIFRRLAEKAPERFSFFEAQSLGGLSALYSMVGRNDEAKREGYKAIHMFRRLVADNRQRFEEALADALSMMGTVLSNGADYAAARDCLVESIEIYSRIAEMAPEKVRDDLDDAQNQLSEVESHLSDVN